MLPSCFLAALIILISCGSFSRVTTGFHSMRRSRSSSFFTLDTEPDTASSFNLRPFRALQHIFGLSEARRRTIAIKMSYYLNTLLSLLISNSKPQKRSVEAPKPSVAAPLLNPPPTLFVPICHPLVGPVTAEVDGYFLKHWNFPNEKAKQKFVNAGFSRVTCLYFPKALDDRIHFACRLLTVLFLIDGEPITTSIFKQTH